ncbi:MAG: CapA family protein, partial [Chloroflexota bacterium]
MIGGYALYSITDRFDSYLRNARTNPTLFEPVGPVTVIAAPLDSNVFLIVLIATVTLNVLFLLGLGYRFSGPLFGILLLWVLSYRNSWGMIFHVDNLLALQVLVLGFTRAADALSLGALRRAPSDDKPASILRGWRLAHPPAHWQYGYAVRLVCLVTTLTYCLSGIAKLMGPMGASWGVGESLRSQVAFDVWRKELLVADPPTLIFAIYDQLWIFTALGIGTLVLELGAPLAVVSGWLAAVWVPSVFLMHYGIMLLMGIEFPYQLSGVAFAPFVPWDRVLSWIHPARLVAFMTRLQAIRLSSGSKSSAGQTGTTIGLAILLALSASPAHSDSPGRLGQSRGAKPGQPFHIVWVGDILLGDAAESRLRAQGYSFPFQHLRAELAADFTIGNAEGPITTLKTKYFPDQQWSYNAQPAAAEALAQAGFRGLSLANNHAFDRGPDGLIDTLEHLRRVGIQPFGAGRDLDEAS